MQFFFKILSNVTKVEIILEQTGYVKIELKGILWVTPTQFFCNLAIEERNSFASGFESKNSALNSYVYQEHKFPVKSLVMDILQNHFRSDLSLKNDYYT